MLEGRKYGTKGDRSILGCEIEVVKILDISRKNIRSTISVKNLRIFLTENLKCKV